MSKEKDKIYYDYRYLIDDILKKYSLPEEEYDNLYYSSIKALMDAIDAYEYNIKQTNDSDFKTFALFRIKSAINNILNKKD
jgi:DNA-directed RNA polymerase specialized sigma subunit